MKKCFLYRRVSSKAQVSGDELERQGGSPKLYLLQNADRLNLSTDDYEVLEDQGVSGWKGHQMHENAALGVFFKRIVAGELNGCVLLCESLDRLSRENPFKCVG